MGKFLGQTLNDYMEIVCRIDESKQQRRKEKELVRMKHHKKARIHSSYIKSYASQRPNNQLNFTRQQIRLPTPREVNLRDILNSIEQEDLDVKAEKCSDDEVS